jgi:hypothetical protein
MTTFLNLPGKIRNLIYAHVFTRNTPIPISKTTSKWPQQSLRIPDTSLILCCRQTYHEARLLPFKLNTFTISTPLVFERLLQHLNPEQWAAIQELELRLEGAAAEDGATVADFLKRMQTRHVTFSALMTGVRCVTIDVRYRQCRLQTYTCECTSSRAARIRNGIADWMRGDGTNGVEGSSMTQSAKFHCKDQSMALQSDSNCVNEREEIAQFIIIAAKPTYSLL